MSTAAKPAVRPDRAHFSSGPCAKRPGWSPDNLKLESLGRSHRSKLGKSRLKLAIDKTRAVLKIHQFCQTSFRNEICKERCGGGIGGYACRHNHPGA